jgi:hypothetical protein
MEHAAHTCRQGSFHHVHRTHIIHLPEQAALTSPELGIGREVIDQNAAANRMAHGLPVADIAAYELDTIQRKMANPSIRPFQDAHALALLQQPAHQMAANEAGSARDENGFLAYEHGLAFPLRSTSPHQFNALGPECPR